MSIAIATYNILAPLYVRPIDKRLGTVQPFAAFEWCEDHVLEWDRRRDQLKKRISKLCQENDIVCFQEVEYEENFQPPKWLLDACGSLKVVTVPSVRDLERNAERNLRVLGVRHAVANMIVCRFEPQWSKASGTTQLAIDHNGWVVINVHLDAGDERKRLDTVFKAIANARLVRGPMSRIVICGDWNAELRPASVLGTLLCTSRDCKVTKEDEESERVIARFDGDFEEWRALRAATRAASSLSSLELIRVNSGPTRCGFDHDGSKRIVSWNLDHIIYDRKLAQVTALEANPLDSTSLTIGIPNEVEPSDHAPVRATLTAVAIGTLTETDEFDLSLALDQVLATEAAEIAQAQLDAALLQPPKPVSKKYRTKPTEEERQRIQDSRKLIKVAMLRKSERRRAFYIDHIKGKAHATAWFERFVFQNLANVATTKSKTSSISSLTAASSSEAYIASFSDAWLS
mmetsp:Transcript_13258/g.17699  ORF Transcript_13258/g.17699 Transcript_13258/m.17699 type:complete len:459 (+) Transcript_13258:230-1606(+)|eukprot:CAMPEP_0197288582 /NCGR_PEP_ID=MMETSP0890-20130614/5721_1 /TAXON_ID=44058 ORGANISM="Aureoumbra lagunensis, Strain CCMP1510" /NCGR_SAMPLE_ID=MMETSP0890 /ASSEMBLY_ACC=CAM_ASM_000533 /LENGTH=458 /DNA_ID=CAMNT_0042759429 /DNA_START=239 /DNA_END=1615 /DNA_ORIENTATION=-